MSRFLLMFVGLSSTQASATLAPLSTLSASLSTSKPIEILPFTHPQDLGLRIFWLRAGDGKCLNSSGQFAVCREEDLWAFRQQNNGYALEHVNGNELVEGWEKETPNNCLRVRRVRKGLRTGTCSKRHTWLLSSQGRVMLDVRGGGCITRVGDSAKIGKCDKYTAVHLYEAKFAAETDEEERASNTATSPAVWRDPESGHYFPSTVFGETQERQQLVGAGAYIRGYVVKIYGCAIYASGLSEADAKYLGSSGSTVDELKKSGAVWKTLIESPDMEKSIILRLSIPVTANQVISAMRDEWDLTQPQKDALYNSAKTHTRGRTFCAAGTELMFTALRGGADLQMRLDGVLMDTIHLPGLASAVFRQYLGDVPVSPTAKASVVEGTLGLMRASSHIQTHDNINTHAYDTYTQRGKGTSKGLKATLPTQLLMAAGAWEVAGATVINNTKTRTKRALEQSRKNVPKRLRLNFSNTFGSGASSSGQSAVEHADSYDYGIGSILACTLALALVSRSRAERAMSGAANNSARQRLAAAVSTL